MSSSCRPSNELQQGGNDVPFQVADGVGGDPDGDFLLDGRDSVHLLFVSQKDWFT